MKPLERSYLESVAAHARRIKEEFGTGRAYRPFEIRTVAKEFRYRKCTVCPECLSKKWCGQNLQKEPK